MAKSVSKICPAYSAARYCRRGLKYACSGDADRVFVRRRDAHAEFEGHGRRAEINPSHITQWT
ncbi:hypothetical protein IG631_00042 [Alternaria alternata]|nr:hypothetical protein IG631_00042 [Alternaria alternata]